MDPNLSALHCCQWLRSCWFVWRQNRSTLFVHIVFHIEVLTPASADVRWVECTITEAKATQLKKRSRCLIDESCAIVDSCSSCRPTGTVSVVSEVSSEVYREKFVNQIGSSSAYYRVTLQQSIHTKKLNLQKKTRRRNKKPRYHIGTARRVMLRKLPLFWKTLGRD